MTLNRSRWLVILAFAAIYIVWGSTYVAILFCLKSFPPFFMGAIRYFIAGIILYLWAPKKSEPISFQSFKKNTMVGVLTLIGGSFAVMWTEQYLTSSVAAIIVAAMPFWYVILDKKQWRFYFSHASILVGLLLGFVGIVLLFSAKEKLGVGHSTMQLISAAILIVGSVSWVAGSLYSKYSPSKDSNIIKVAIQLLSSGIILFFISFIAGEMKGFFFRQVTSDSWLALLFLTIMGSVVTYNAYIWLLSKKPPVLVGTYAYVNPVIAVLLGVLLANENLHATHITALISILIGVLLINIPKYKTIA